MVAKVAVRASGPVHRALRHRNSAFVTWHLGSRRDAVRSQPSPPDSPGQQTTAAGSATQAADIARINTKAQWVLLGNREENPRAAISLLSYSVFRAAHRSGGAGVPRV